MNLYSLNINKILKTIFSIESSNTNSRITGSNAVIEKDSSSFNSIYSPYLPLSANTSNQVENEVADKISNSNNTEFI